MTRYRIYSWKFNGGLPGYFPTETTNLDDDRELFAMNRVDCHPDLAVRVYTGEDRMLARIVRFDGKKLRKVRLAQRLSQGDLADSIGVVKSYVAMLEGGQRVPNEDRFQSLLDALKVTEDALLADTPDTD